MKKFIIFAAALVLAGQQLNASVILSGMGVVVNFPRDQYDFTIPRLLGTKGLMLLLKDKKTGMHNFSLSAGGHLASAKRFNDLCQKTHREYKMLGGTLSAIKHETRNGLPCCSFQKDSNGSFDLVELVYDQKNYRYFALTGMLLKDKQHKKTDIGKYTKEFQQLALAVSYTGGFQ